ncbi:MAG: hypothetical protein OJF55_000111 [Rhodanobacteraceae bacterium]|jgi:hypothetical protein|nr:MAG: hypothetical protein OJF55_000111 [Rhodanobacteraceae bacterium]
MRAAFGGAIAVVLLGLWVYLIVTGCQIVACANTTGCVAPTAASFNDVMAQALAVIGGLVSALVIAELAVTRSGEAPAAHLLVANASPRAKLALQVISGIYVFAWLVAGLAALLFGMRSPHTLQPLTSVGQSWLGLAVAAAYAYFGLRPSQ